MQQQLTRSGTRAVLDPVAWWTNACLTVVRASCNFLLNICLCVCVSQSYVCGINQ